jgi:hypothetical protein
MAEPRRVPETPAEHQLYAELQTMAAVVAAHLPPPGWVYASPYDFILQHGAFYTPTPRPAGYYQGAPKCCFGNAIVAAVLHADRYVEGWALLSVGGEPGIGSGGHRGEVQTSSYGGVEQRWVLIYSEARPPQAQRTADNQLRQQTDKEVKAFKTLCRTPFACEADARQALSAFAQDLQVTFLATSTVRATPRYDQQGRPEKAFNPIRWSTTSTEPWLPRSRLGVALFCWHSLAVSARPMADCTQSS